MLKHLAMSKYMVMDGGVHCTCSHGGRGGMGGCVHKAAERGDMGCTFSVVKDVHTCIIMTSGWCKM